MGYFSHGGLISQLNVIATAAGTTTLAASTTADANLGKQFQVFTGTLAQTIVLPAATSMNVGQSFEIFNQSTGSLTLQFNGGAAFTDASGKNYSTITANTTLIVTLQTNGTSAGTWAVVSGGSSSASAGAKNYLSAIVTSQSSTPNTGNGNFETGSTVGFSLAHSSLTSNFPSTVGTAGNSFSSAGGAHGGSAASGNLSITTVSSGQLAGSFSLSEVSSAATTAGDMLISDAFNIDTEDQAKVMTIKGYYKAQSGTANANFSGTSSNSFGLAVYDVTNALWIMPAGVWNIVQGTGTGYFTATFQTTSNSTQYQLAFFNANATAGAITMYLDDLFVGPQTSPMAPAMSDWQSYTPTVTSSGATNFSFSTIAGKYRQVGDTYEIEIYAHKDTNAASGTSVVLFSLPTGAVPDTTKMPGAGVGGVDNLGQTLTYGILTSGQYDRAYSVSMDTGQSTTALVVTNPTTASYLKAIYFLANSIITLYAVVPITGKSSNSVASSDTDTRVCAARYTGSGTQTIATSTITVVNFSVLTYDTHAAVTTGASWKFTAPITGYYAVNAGGFYSSGTYTVNQGADMYLYKNGLLYQNISSAIANTTTAVNLQLNASDEIFLNAGDYIDIRVDQNSGSNKTFNPAFISVNRLSGPAVITATESVNMKYTSAATVVTGVTQTVVVFPTKVYDSHNAYNTSTGLYTCPVSGKYSIKSGITVGAVAWNAGDTFRNQVYHNGSLDSTGRLDIQSTQASFQAFAGVYTTVNCLAGDTINIEAFSSEAVTLNGGAQANWLCIERVGN